jgi:AraC-like DNA-binding protein
MQEYWLFVIVCFGCLLAIVVAMILVFAGTHNHSFSSRVLACFLVFLSISLLNLGLTISNHFFDFPFLFRSAVFFTMCFPPLLYIYVRTMIRQEFKFYRSDALFLILPILFTVKFVPVYLLSGQEKLNLITTMLEHKVLLAQERDGWLPGAWGIIFRLAHALIFAVFSGLLIRSAYHKLAHSGGLTRHNRVVLRWLTYLVLVMTCTYLALVFEYLMQFMIHGNQYPLATLTFCAAVIFISLSLLLRPEILYGLTGWINETIPVSTVAPALLPLTELVREPTLSPSLSREQGEKIRVLLEEHFQSHKPFLKPGYLIGNLSAEIKIPQYQISTFINQEYGKNFNELINDFRIDHLTTMIEREEGLHHFTLEALGRKVGFNSRTSFIAAVKKKTGKTPAEFFKIKKGNFKSHGI